MHHHTSRYSKQHIDGLVYDCSFLIANALEILQFCTKIGVIHNIHQTYTQDKERHGCEKFNPLIRETMMTSWHRNALCIICPSRGISLATIIFRWYIYIYIYIWLITWRALPYLVNEEAFPCRVILTLNVRGFYQVNIMVADALAPYVARTSAPKILTLYNRYVLVLLEEWFQLPVSFQCGIMT